MATLMETTGPRTFSTTHWSVVLEAKDSSSPHYQEALNTLCEAYWYPLYAFVRSKGRSPEEAEDLTQAFFAKVIGHQVFAKVDREKGRFRSFLLAAIGNFLNDQHDRATAIKRGGKACQISLDQIDPEERYRLEPADPTAASPEKSFDRRWALTILDRAKTTLREQLRAAGKGDVIEHLLPRVFHKGGDDRLKDAEIATKMSKSEPAIRNELTRLRHRFAELVRAEVAQTVADPSELNEELSYLLSVVGD